MPLISEQLPNLMNGVSQQAVSMRLSSQAEEQINGLSSIVDGNTKRPPSKFVKKIDNAKLDGRHVHLINRDVNERYIVVADSGGIRVFDLDGTERTVNTPNGVGYLNSPNPSVDLRTITVADYTFIVNRTKVTKSFTGNRTPAQPYFAQAFVKSVNYDTGYTIKVNGNVVADYATPGDGSLNTNMVIGELVTDLTANLDTDNTWIVENKSPVIEVRRQDGAEFDFEFTDNKGNALTQAVTPTMANFTDLPKTNKRDRVVEIVGESESDAESYYLKFITQNGDTGPAWDRGYWEETVAPDIPVAFDWDTMPHALVRVSDGTFTFRNIGWGIRTVGDLNSAPWPTFIDRTINDIYFDRRRLCFLSDDNVVMSRAGDFFQFFPQSVSSVLDDDPIDVTAGTNKVSILQSAIPFDQKIVLFSDQTQFSIDSEFLLASQPPSVLALTDYESSREVSPVAAGKTVFFASEQGDRTSILEYHVLEDMRTPEAQDITDHVPSYIPPGVVTLSASEASNMVVAVSKFFPDTVFVYKSHWRGREKLQSSWSKWAFSPDSEVYAAEFVNNEMYLLIGRPDGTYIEMIDVSENQTDKSEPFTYRIDRRVTEEDVVNLVYDPINNKTDFGLPYGVGSGDSLVVVSRRGGIRSKAVQLKVIETYNGNAVAVEGDLTGETFYAGLLYDHVYTFSEQVLKVPSSGGGQAPVAAGRLQLLKWWVHYEDTGYFRAEVKADGRQAYTYHLTGVNLGADNAILGQASVRSGKFPFRINSKSDRVQIKLINDTFAPSTFTAAEWEGRFTRQSSRL